MTVHVGFLIFGGILAGIGALILVNEVKKKKNNTAPVKAEVVSYFTSVDYDSETNSKTEHHFPIMRYCVSGQWYEQQSETSWNREKHKIGEITDILYDPKHPEHFSFPGEKFSLIVSVLLILAGIAACVMAFVL